MVLPEQDLERPQCPGFFRKRRNAFPNSPRQFTLENHRLPSASALPCSAFRTSHACTGSTLRQSCRERNRELRCNCAEAVQEWNWLWKAKEKPAEKHPRVVLLTITLIHSASDAGAWWFPQHPSRFVEPGKGQQFSFRGVSSVAMQKGQISLCILEWVRASKVPLGFSGVQSVFSRYSFCGRL